MHISTDFLTPHIQGTLEKERVFEIKNPEITSYLENIILFFILSIVFSFLILIELPQSFSQLSIKNFFNTQLLFFIGIDVFSVTAFFYCMIKAIRTKLDLIKYGYFKKISFKRDGILLTHSQKGNDIFLYYKDIDVNMKLEVKKSNAKRKTIYIKSLTLSFIEPMELSVRHCPKDNLLMAYAVLDRKDLFKDLTFRVEPVSPSHKRIAEEVEYQLYRHLEIEAKIDKMGFNGLSKYAFIINRIKYVLLGMVFILVGGVVLFTAHKTQNSKLSLICIPFCLLGIYIVVKTIIRTIKDIRSY